MFDCFNDISAISTRSHVKSPTTTNIRTRTSDEGFYRMAEEQEDICLDDLDKKSTPTATPMTRLLGLGLNNFDFMKEADTMSPICSPIQHKGFYAHLASERNSLSFPKSLIDNSHISNEDSSFEDDELSYLDWENCTFHEEVREVEIDEVRGINVYDSIATTPVSANSMRPFEPKKKSRFGNRMSINKSKSVNYGQNPPIEQTPKALEMTEQEEDSTNHYQASTPSEESFDSYQRLRKSSVSSKQSNVSGVARRRHYKRHNRQVKSQIIESSSRDENGKFRINQYTLEEDLGGSYMGQVKLCINPDSHAIYSIKTIEKGLSSGMVFLNRLKEDSQS